MAKLYFRYGAMSSSKTANALMVAYNYKERGKSVLLAKPKNGIRTDFQRNLFEGSKWLLAWADELEILRTICWCGNGASCNTRYDENGNIIREGEQLFVGGNNEYVTLCRKHYKEGLIKNPISNHIFDIEE